MLKIHKFNKRVKTTKKEDYQKANQSSSTNSSMMNSSSLSRITKTQEDLLFRTDRKMPDEKDIYDIENKLDTNNSNTLEVNDFERENYMSNKDVTIHKKIVPTTDSVVNIKERENEKTKEKEKADDKNTQSSSNQSILCREFIVFLLIMIILLSVVAIIIFYVIKSSS